jgi:hypothetical protein
VLLAIFGMEAWHALPQHEAMPPPEEAMAKARQEGVGRSMTKAASQPPLHGRPWAGHGSIP